MPRLVNHPPAEQAALDRWLAASLQHDRAHIAAAIGRAAECFIDDLKPLRAEAALLARCLVRLDDTLTDARRIGAAQSEREQRADAGRREAAR